MMEEILKWLEYILIVKPSATRWSKYDFKSGPHGMQKKKELYKNIKHRTNYITFPFRRKAHHSSSAYGIMQF